MFNVQSAYTLFARQETQKIRKLSSGIRKLTDLFYIQCDKLEFGVCFINFFRSTQARSWDPYFFQVHLWLLRNMIF